MVALCCHILLGTFTPPQISLAGSHYSRPAGSDFRCSHSLAMALFPKKSANPFPGHCLLRVVFGYPSSVSRLDCRPQKEVDEEQRTEGGQTGRMSQPPQTYCKEIGRVTSSEDEDNSQRPQSRLECGGTRLSLCAWATFNLLGRTTKEYIQFCFTCLLYFCLFLCFVLF